MCVDLAHVGVDLAPVTRLHFAGDVAESLMDGGPLLGVPLYRRDIRGDQSACEGEALAQFSLAVSAHRSRWAW